MAGGGGGGALQNEIQPVFDSTADVRRATQLLQAVEDEARDAAGSFCSLVASLREAMSEVTGSTRDHLACYNNAAGSLQNGCIDAATKGNKFVNSCLRCLFLMFFLCYGKPWSNLSIKQLVIYHGPRRIRQDLVGFRILDLTVHNKSGHRRNEGGSNQDYVSDEIAFSCTSWSSNPVTCRFNWCQEWSFSRLWKVGRPFHVIDQIHHKYLVGFGIGYGRLLRWQLFGQVRAHLRQRNYVLGVYKAREEALQPRSNATDTGRQNRHRADVAVQSRGVSTLRIHPRALRTGDVYLVSPRKGILTQEQQQQQRCVCGGGGGDIGCRNEALKAIALGVPLGIWEFGSARGQPEEGEREGGREERNINSI
ncbi:hypothetical protein SELMODRAFT_426939 [Selaginella moellendorffii]|uniref:Uncharacterized protein n=1 Tax=Selaginella moellendorffii TaxID=88036 RepID=D8SXZ6_SELML|nr:hypothetical protein SELMODRAFT_426939 [Selaginella moellendorffii]